MRPAHAADVGLQICSILERLHAAGIIHGALSPSNVLLTAEGMVLVDGLGLGRLLPETAPGLRVDVPADERSDLFMLGTLMYLMLTGSLPMRPPTSGRHQQYDQHRSLRDQHPRLPVDLSALVDHLLAADPARRPARAADVRTRLAILAGEQLADPTPTDPGTATALPSASGAVHRLQRDPTGLIGRRRRGGGCRHRRDDCPGCRTRRRLP